MPTGKGKYTGFKGGSHAKSYTPKNGETKAKTQLRTIQKNLGKKGKK